jgi:hypothetical protein
VRWKKIKPRPATYWSPWFAWHPVKIEDTGETVWLETVWRHVDRYGGWDGVYHEYRYRGDVHWAGANLKHLPGETT